jgi:hypothetical protein
MTATLVQEQSNTQSTSETATTIAATLSPAATAGNLIITACSTDKNAGTWTQPSGFTLLTPFSGTNVSLAIAYKVAAGGETTIEWTTSNSEEHNMWLAEYSGLADTSPEDKTASANSGDTDVSSQTSGTTAATTQNDELAVAAFAVDSASIGGTTGYSNGFTEEAELTDINSGNSVLWIATKNLTSTGTVETTLTISGGGSDQMAGQIVTFKEAAAAPSIAARAYRFYADGTETGSTALVNENTAYDADVTSGNVNLQLRYGLQESAGVAGSATDDYQLQYSVNAGAWNNVAGASSVIKAFPSSNLTDAASTTSRLSAGTGSFVAGEIDEADGIVTDWQITANNYSDLLYSITIVSADVSDNDTILFRALRNGAAINWDEMPTLTITKTAPPVEPRFGSGVRVGAVGSGGIRVVSP